jgi:hypothetical protein
MNKSFRIIGAGIAMLSAVALAANLQGVLIKRVYKEGDVAKYRIKAELEIAGTNATFTGLTVEKVLKVNADGTYEVESSQSEAKAVFGGQEMDIPDQGASVTVYKPTGDVVELRGPNVNADGYRMSNLNNFFPPAGEVKVGDTWTKEIKGDTKTGATDATAKFKYVADEKVGARDTIKIEANFAEKAAEGAKSDYTIWLDKTDFSMVKTTGKWVNVPMAGSPAPLNGTVELTRVEG